MPSATTARRSRGISISTLIQIDMRPVDEPEARLPMVPSEVGARRDDVHFLHDVLPDLGEEQAAVLRIPPEALRIPKSVGVDLTHRLRIVVRHEWVARWDSVLAVRDVVAERVDAKQFSVRRSAIRRHVQR